ncbi:putative quinol monooxygenase [Microbacterium pumilum]|uniref:ABM domain-containing protein n=1 Tax=Microbacterium pumilum TaxID=344165 RepID=A0ABN2T194_9MICO
MLLITGSARPASDARERLVAAAREITAATQGDPGCTLYQFGLSLDGNVIVSVELWRDQAALDAHMSHEHTQRFLSALDGLIDGEPVMQQTEL